jgi:membrane associated rhomboid family serine protease
MRTSNSKLFYSILFPFTFVALLWLIFLFELVEDVNLSWYGLFPRTLHGMLGILTSPLLHADFDHLWSNSIPLLVLGPIIMYFYRPIAFQIFFWVYLMTGIWVWAAGRSYYHIGASGIIYGFVTFVFFSGVFRKDPRLLALSLFVAFIYGGTVWGILPIAQGISFESHLLGSLAGLITAYNFRKEGPPPVIYDLGTDEENDAIDVSGEEYPGDEEEKKTFHIEYTYLPKEDDQKKENEL